MIVYFSSVSGNTDRFVKKLGLPSVRIPIKFPEDTGVWVDQPSVLVVPSYGAGPGDRSIPPQVRKFLRNELSRRHIVGVVGTGNTNFGDGYCKAARMIAAKLKVPLLDTVEIFGTPDDVERVREKVIRECTNGNT